MLNTFNVGDKFEMLMTVCSFLSPESFYFNICLEHQQINPKILSSTSLQPLKIFFLPKSTNSTPVFLFTFPPQKHTKVGCVFPMVIVSMLSNAEFGPNDHWDDVPHFMLDWSFSHLI